MFDNQRYRNEIARNFDSRDRFHVNEVRFDPASGAEHKIAVMDFFFEHHITQGHHVLTRAHIDTQKRTERLCADACCLDCALVHEVAKSEGDESLERKKKIWEEKGLSYETERI